MEIGSSRVKMPLGKLGAAAGATMRVETGRTGTGLGVGLEVAVGGKGVLVGSSRGVGGGARLRGGATTV